MAKYRLDINLSDNTTNPIEFTVPKTKGTYQLDLPLSNGSKIKAGTITVDEKINTYRLTLNLDNGKSIDCGTFSTEAIRIVMAYLLAGNMKMNGTKADISDYLNAMKSTGLVPSRTETIICPQTCLISSYKDAITGAGTALSFLKLGAQLCSPNEKGAYTGQNSVDALMSVGADYFIVGHSEVKQHLGGQNVDLVGQLEILGGRGAKILFCVGEDLAQHNAGNGQTVVNEQLSVLFNTNVDNSWVNNNISIVYEPVWAIGTGKEATPEDAQTMCEYIRNRVKTVIGNAVGQNIKVLWGGSVNMNNCQSYIEVPDVDGFLAGGIAMKPIDFINVAKVMDNN